MTRSNHYSAELDAESLAGFDSLCHITNLFEDDVHASCLLEHPAHLEHVHEPQRQPWHIRNQQHHHQHYD